MAYTKTVWHNGEAPAIDEDKLNKIEQGIYDAHEALEEKLEDAPSDNKTYGRKNGTWTEVTGGSGATEIFDVEYDVTTYAEITDALAEGKLPVIKNCDEGHFGDITLYYVGIDDGGKAEFFGYDSEQDAIAIATVDEDEDRTVWQYSDVDIPTKTSDLTNDSGFLTSIPKASGSALGGVKTPSTYGTGTDANGNLYGVKIPKAQYGSTSINAIVSKGTLDDSFYNKDEVDNAIAPKLSDAPLDNKTYGRKNGAWTEVTGGGGGGDNKTPMTLLATVDCTQVHGSITLDNLDDFTEFYVEWEATANDSGTDSGYGLKINNTKIANTAVTIKKSGDGLYGWTWIKWTGCCWFVTFSSGANSDGHLGVESNAKTFYSQPIMLTPAQEFVLVAPVATYQAKSGTVKIYGR